MLEKISLIITTYNRVTALELVLQSVLQQIERPDEIIIADDGSTPETQQLCQGYEKNLPLIYCWQEDKGFRAAAIRNKAIAIAHYPYLVLIDGDMILHPAFIQDHKNIAQSRAFIQGKRVLLNKQLTQRALQNQQINFNFFSMGINNRLNTIHCPILTKLITGAQDPRQGIRSCNMAFWREDVLNINGFNEEFSGWGREDSEFAARMQQSGIKRINFKFGAIAYHLYHLEQSRDFLDKNDTLLEQTLREKRTWCEKGIRQYL